MRPSYECFHPFKNRELNLVWWAVQTQAVGQLRPRAVICLFLLKDHDERLTFFLKAIGISWRILRGHGAVFVTSFLSHVYKVASETVESECRGPWVKMERWISNPKLRPRRQWWAGRGGWWIHKHLPLCQGNWCGFRPHGAPGPVHGP